MYITNKVPNWLPKVWRQCATRWLNPILSDNIADEYFESSIRAASVDL